MIKHLKYNNNNINNNNKKIIYDKQLNKINEIKKEYKLKMT